MLPAVHSIAGARMDTQFSHTITHRFAVAQIAELNLMQPGPNSSLRQFVAETAEPFRVGFMPILLLVTDEFDHGNKCSIKATTLQLLGWFDSMRKR